MRHFFQKEKKTKYNWNANTGIPLLGMRPFGVEGRGLGVEGGGGLLLNIVKVTMSRPPTEMMPRCHIRPQVC